MSQTEEIHYFKAFDLRSYERSLLADPVKRFFNVIKLRKVMQAFINHYSNAGITIYKGDKPNPISVTHNMNSRIISDFVRDPLMPFDLVVRNKITHIQSSFYPEPRGATIAIQLPSKPKFFLQNGSSSGGIYHPFA